MTTTKKNSKKTLKDTRDATKPECSIVKVTIEFGEDAKFLTQSAKRLKLPVAELVRRGALMYARTMSTKTLNSHGSLTQGRIAKAYAKLVREGAENITPVRLANACEPPSNSRSCEKWLTANGHTFEVTYRGQTVTRGAV